MSTFIRFDGWLWENMTFERRLGWETERIAHRPAEGDGAFTLELRDAGGSVLVAVSPRVDFSRYCTQQDHQMRSTRVLAYLPLHPDGREIVFRRGEHVIDRDSVAAQAPRVRRLQVTRQPRGRFRLSWQAAHPAGKPLSFNVVYLAPGTRGFSLARGLRRAEFTADLASLPGGRGARLAVLATDGTRSVFAISRRLDVPDKPPRISIHSPREDEVVPADQPITLSGQALDVAGANVPDQGLVWRVDGKNVASGSRLALAEGLEPGLHRATLRFKAARGRAVEGTVAFTVAPRSKGQQRLRQLLARGLVR